MKRFNIVVLNYKRLHSFLSNFDRIEAFDPSQDKITILTCSPSEDERQRVKDFSEKYQVQVRYLTRRNFGIDQCARVEYFSGKIDNLQELLDTEYIFQFQEHYLDVKAPYSKWGAEEKFRVKGDVVPDNIIFDLDSLSRVFRENRIAAAFCDRNHPCWFQRAGSTYIAPNGGNFILSTKQINDPYIQRELNGMYHNCDNTYGWAVYAEYKWGELFFSEGRAYYDIKRDKIYSHFPRDQFYVSPDPVDALYDFYEGSSVKRILYKAKAGINKLVKSR